MTRVPGGEEESLEEFEHIKDIHRTGAVSVCTQRGAGKNDPN